MGTQMGGARLGTQMGGARLGTGYAAVSVTQYTVVELITSYNRTLGWLDQSHQPELQGSPTEVCNNY